jgi:glycosyltransferase involved in cell wall biosynthesis
VRLLVAGDGPEEEALKALARKLGVGERVIFLGRVSRAETWHVRKTSQVYVLNSTYEGLPHTVLTSFAAGIPTVATDIPGTDEAVYHEQSGLLVKPGEAQELASAIARLFKDEALRKRLAEGGGLILAEKFSWEAHLRTLMRLLESLRAEPRHKA